MTEHKHADTLRAIADGAKFPDDFEWKHYSSTWNQARSSLSDELFDGEGEFRRKPVPKPDIVHTACIYNDKLDSLQWWNWKPNVEFTFTADGVLKGARVLP